jgi:hypothetical protein
MICEYEETAALMTKLVRHPNAGPPGPHFLNSLRNSEWTTAAGLSLPIHKMSTAHLWNVLGYLRWYAPEIVAKVPDAADLSRHAVITSQPIWAAICRELVIREEIEHREDALSYLLSGGETPWERKERYAAAAKIRRQGKAAVSRAAKSKSATP